MKPLILHGHFYQPPRENPWTGEIGREPGAAPFRNWNERVDHECYRANAFGRVLDERHRISAVVNNFAQMSFDVGPTLLHWLALHDGVTLARMVAADRESLANFGHGNAMAQGYNHTILPLDGARDRRTQIRWGLAAFRHYFDRDADALWLPETAVNGSVVDELIEHDLKFVILAPHQARRFRPLEGGAWQSVEDGSIDTGRAYLLRHGRGGGRSMAAFFYDGEFARSMGFGDTMKDSAHFGRALRAAARHRGLVHGAVDGETFGHHHAWGDRVLAHALSTELPSLGLRTSNYMAELRQNPPRFEVELALGEGDRGTSWSCAHGVERWRSNCGCRMDVSREPAQQWRGPLREALIFLREAAAEFFEREAGEMLIDPWAARDAFIDLILEPERERPWLTEHGESGLSRGEAARVMALMRMQQQLLFMFTSCGWFFDEIAGIESRQVLRHAARAIELWEELGGEPPVAEFLEILRSAHGGEFADVNGAAIYSDILRDERRAEAASQGDAQSTADREQLRLAIDRLLVAAMEASNWSEVERVLDVSEQLDFSGLLFRAQETFLEHRQSATPELAEKIGMELGFSPDFPVPSEGDRS